MQVSSKVQNDGQCGGRHPHPRGGRHLILRAAVPPPAEPCTTWRRGLAGPEHGTRSAGFVRVRLHAVHSRLIKAELQASVSNPWEDGVRRVPPQGVFLTGHGLDRPRYVYTLRFRLHVPVLTQQETSSQPYMYVFSTYGFLLGDQCLMNKICTYTVSTGGAETSCDFQDSLSKKIHPWCDCIAACTYSYTRHI